jgi:hypothetical protein
MNVEFIGYGIAGGIIPEFIALYKLRQIKRSRRPEWITSVFYWVSTILMIGAGGGIVWFYMEVIQAQMSALVAIHLGATAPVILQAASQGKIKAN